MKCIKSYYIAFSLMISLLGLNSCGSSSLGDADILDTKQPESLRSDASSNLVVKSIDIRSCLYHESIESVSPNPHYIELNDGELTWTTPLMYPDKAYRPGEHPVCIENGIHQTYLTFNGEKVVLPIDDIHWKLFVLEIRLDGKAVQSYRQWVGKFNLEQLFPTFKIDKSKTDIIKEVINNNYYEDRPVGWISLLGKNKIKLGYSGLILRNKETGEETYLESPNVYYFSFLYEYYGWDK